MADGTDVVLASVVNFGNKTIDQAWEFQNGVLAAMARTYGAASASTSGLPEAADFVEKHAAAVERLGMFSTEAFQGLAALGSGANAIAQIYGRADLSQADQMNTVIATFNPDANTDSVLSSLAEQQAAAEAAAAAAPKTQPAVVPEPEVALGPQPVSPVALPGSAPLPGSARLGQSPAAEVLRVVQAQAVAPAPEPITPDQEVRNHEERYGEYEKWTPAPAEPEPVPRSPEKQVDDVKRSLMNLAP